MMVIRTIKEINVKNARKDYKCDACEYVTESIGFMKFTFTEKKAIVRARKNKWKILKGQPYVDQFNVNGDGDKYHFRAIPEIHALCVKYHIYETFY